MTKKIRKNNIGSTVIEVLIATTIVAFALTGLAALMTNNVKNSAEADYREAAASIAQDTMEKVRQRKTTVPWTTFKDTLLTTPIGGLSTGCGTTTSRYNTSFWIQCGTAAAAAPILTDGLIVTVQVCWPSSTTCSGTAFSTTTVQTFYNN